MSRIVRRLPEGTYVELVRSLFGTLLPTSIMAASFLMTGLLISTQTHDALLGTLTGLGCVAAVLRLCVLLYHKEEAAKDVIGWRRARTLERRFAASYFAFAVIFGLFAARTFMVATPEAHMLVAGLLFGYGAGVAAGLSLRPWISIPSIVIAIVPAVLAAWARADTLYTALGILLIAFLGGGVNSMVTRYRNATLRLNASRVTEKLARRDDLTGLPNRLSLRERFEAFSAASGEGNIIAVHCLDLDRFKPVNDLYGHPVGDALLKAVSGRLSALLRRGDFVARLGGDEFVVIQTGATHGDEAELLARRIVRAISSSYICGDHTITIGVSVGYALSSECGSNLDLLVACADEALYMAKRDGTGIGKYVERNVNNEPRMSVAVPI